jgi:hypothetical protein
MTTLGVETIHHVSVRPSSEIATYCSAAGASPLLRGAAEASGSGVVPVGRAISAARHISSRRSIPAFSHPRGIGARRFRPIALSNVSHPALRASS